MTTAKLFKLTKDGNKLLGAFVVKNGRVVARPVAGSETILKQVLSRSILAGSTGRRVKAMEDPELWVRSLPFHYHGTYLWAEVV